MFLSKSSDLPGSCSLAWGLFRCLKMPFIPPGKKSRVEMLYIRKQQASQPALHGSEVLNHVMKRSGLESFKVLREGVYFKVLSLSLGHGSPSFIFFYVPLHPSLSFSKVLKSLGKINIVDTEANCPFLKKNFSLSWCGEGNPFLFLLLQVWGHYSSVLLKEFKRAL